MIITIKIEGEIGKKEPIEGILEVPDNWKPTFETFCKCKGTLRFLVEQLSQIYSPPPSNN